MTATRSRRKRADAPMAMLVDAFRAPSDSAAMSEVLAQLAMRLTDADDRALFQRADGATAMLDHLARSCEEQATLAHAWRESQLLGVAWTEFEVHDSLELTLVAICHASVDASIAGELNELRAVALLFGVFSTLPTSMTAQQTFALECVRNLSFVELEMESLPSSFLSELWRVALHAGEPLQREIAADILCNVASYDPTRVLATQERIASLLALFFESSSPVTLQIALADLLCNLCCDASYCLLAIYELDELKPARGYQRHSGAVFFTDATERVADPALRQSMEALAHNISWSDPDGKRSVQKLAISSYLRMFAASPAINS